MGLSSLQRNLFSSRDMVKLFEDYSTIYDDLANSFVENTKTNVFCKGISYFGLRKRRNLLLIFVKAQRTECPVSRPRNHTTVNKLAPNWYFEDEN